jgi:hypothetical protein
MCASITIRSLSFSKQSCMRVVNMDEINMTPVWQFWQLGSHSDHFEALRWTLLKVLSWVPLHRQKKSHLGVPKGIQKSTCRTPQVSLWTPNVAPSMRCRGQSDQKHLFLSRAQNINFCGVCRKGETRHRNKALYLLHGGPSPPIRTDVFLKLMLDEDPDTNTRFYCLGCLPHQFAQRRFLGKIM